MKTERIARLPGPPQRARELFRHVEGWPAWLPGVHSVEVEAEAAGLRRVILQQVVYGQEIRQVAEIEPTAAGLRQRRVGGQPKRWDLDWSFEPAEDGAATRVRVEIDYDFGLWARFTPRSVTEGAIEEIFDELVAAAAEQLGGGDVLFHGDAATSDRLRIDPAEGDALRVIFDGVVYRAEPV